MSTWQLATVGDPCPECGAPLRSEACWSCDGAAASPFFMCDECGDKGQVPLCPNRASHLSPWPNQEMANCNYWFGSAGQYGNPFRSRV